MRVLVIYNLIPEDLYTTVVHLPEDRYKQIAPADGYTVNSDESVEEKDNAAMLLNFAFATSECPDTQQVDGVSLADQQYWWGRIARTGVTLNNDNCSSLDATLVSGWVLW